MRRSWVTYSHYGINSEERRELGDLGILGDLRGLGDHRDLHELVELRTLDELVELRDLGLPDPRDLGALVTARSSFTP